jgi:hypothetical protein
MAFILSAQRETVVGAFEQYRAYLASKAATCPRSAYALATSDWYFDPRDHRCPHDAWLESITITEPATGKRSEQRGTTIRIRLLGAYHDGFIELSYARVIRYSLTSPSSERGLGDWRYDEFRVAPGGHLIHEIEWAGFPREEGSRWTIESADIEFQWIPRSP